MSARSITLVFMVVVALCTIGCQGASTVEDNGPDVAQIRADPKAFIGTSVSMKALPVFWTATYVTGDGTVSKNADPNGFTCMVLVNQRNPLEGVLMCTRLSQSLKSFTAQKAATLRVEGPVKTFVKPDLIAYMKQQHGVDIAVSPSGQPVWIENQLPVTGASPSAEAR